MATSWFIKKRVGWTVTGTGWAALLVFAALLVASLVFLHGITRLLLLTSILVMAFLAFAVAKIDLRRLDTRLSRNDALKQRTGAVAG